MSSIQTYLNKILSAIYGEEVRQSIHDAIKQCYDDVSSPSLQTTAFYTAVQQAINDGTMTDLSIEDGSITTAKLADSVVTTTKLADSVVTEEKLGSDVISMINRGSGGSGLTSEIITALLACFEHTAWSDANGQTYYNALSSALNSGGGDSGGGDSGGDTTGEWTVEKPLSFSTSGYLSSSDGTVSTNDSYLVSDEILIPTDATSYAFDVNNQVSLVFFDSTHAYIGSGYGSEAYSGTGEYGDGFTLNDLIFHAIPSTAKYMKVCKKSSTSAMSKITFMHNVQLTETSSPVANKLYYFDNGGNTSSSAYTFYLNCAGMKYAQIRPVDRCGFKFYDTDHNLLSSIAVSNNAGNNVAIPDNAIYMQTSVTNTTSTSYSGRVSRINTFLMKYTNTSVSEW